ncbi:MAG: phosphoenolpyruvate synthase [Nannocystaceae bacterium]
MSEAPRTAPSAPLIAWFDDLRASDVDRVGGKNASLGEMVSQLAGVGIPVPPGFATTAAAYWHMIDAGGLRPVIARELAALDGGARPLAAVGAAIRQAIAAAPLPEALAQAIRAAYRALGERVGEADPSVAVRSSATAEDLPEASFAGQQETYLNVRGEARVLEACRDCYASLFTDRAITYRGAHGFDHLKVALSIGVQQMARSDRGAAGVMFSLDTETGFPDVVLINAAWGLGENVVKGEVNPDEFLVYKPTLGAEGRRPILRKRRGDKEKTMVFARGAGKTTRNLTTPRARRERFAITDDDVLKLAAWAVAIERHYSERTGAPTPMDIEWAKDGETGALYVVQARPETVQSRRRGAAEIVRYVLEDRPAPVVEGRAVGAAIVHGEVCVVRHADALASFRPGSILVAEITDPDWVPIMRQAAGIITDHGGRTCHAAIVSRELGIPAVVGAGDATVRLKDGDAVTLSCAEGEVGRVYAGALPFRREVTDLGDVPATKTQIMLNLADPDAALRWWRLPIDGIGLARLEFMITEHVKVHPMALAHPERITDPEAQAQIAALTAASAGPAEYFVETLGRGIGTLAAAVHPRPVIVRMSDFKTNEYARLLGGAAFEPTEENPMIGFRGASRYYSDRYRDGFALECRAIRFVREVLGLRNVVVMIPFCRTLAEADRVLEVMAAEGLPRGPDLEVYVMCEIPANVVLAAQFAERFDGFSIGSNDLTQLVLGVDRDSELLAHLFDERDPAVVAMIRQVIAAAREAGRKIGICGQAPSDHPEFAELLVDAGIDSISLNPDSVLGVRQRVAQLEARRARA